MIPSGWADLPFFAKDWPTVAARIANPPDLGTRRVRKAGSRKGGSGKPGGGASNRKD